MEKTWGFAHECLKIPHLVPAVLVLGEGLTQLPQEELLFSWLQVQYPPPLSFSRHHSSLNNFQSLFMIAFCFIFLHKIITDWYFLACFLSLLIKMQALWTQGSFLPVYFLIEIYLIYNVAFVFRVQKSDSALYHY